jgi:hypothetical protein
MACAWALIPSKTAQGTSKSRRSSTYSETVKCRIGFDDGHAEQELKSVYVFLLHCMRPFMAQNGRASQRMPRQLSGAKRTFQLDRVAAANDPLETYAALD